MAKYYRQQGETKRRKTLRFIRPIVLLVFIGILVGGAVFLFDILRQQDDAETSSALTKPTSSVVDSGSQLQKTPYFQLRIPTKWRVVTAETKDGKYVYRQFKGSLVEQDLTIEVNNSTQVLIATTQISRVMPLIINNAGGVDIINTPLDHCKKVSPESRQAKLVTMDRVTFPCNPGSPAYEITAGLVNGTNIMTLPRPDGSVATYKIHYRNLSFSANPQDFLEIMKSFETK